MNGVILGEYDDNDIERVSYDDTGNLLERFGVKVGEQLPGTTMDSGEVYLNQNNTSKQQNSRLEWTIRSKIKRWS